MKIPLPLGLVIDCIKEYDINKQKDQTTMQTESKHLKEVLELSQNMTITFHYYLCSVLKLYLFQTIGIHDEMYLSQKRL